MVTSVRALETTGIIEESQLRLDAPLPVAGPSRVRVIVLLEEEVTDVDEQEWLYTAATNPAFSFLKEPAEDIYTLADGRPFDDRLTDEG
jgi:hypothetical protein